MKNFGLFLAFVSLISCGGSGSKDFELEADLFDGSYSISGEVTLPAAVTDKVAVLTVTKVSGTGTGTELLSQTVSGSSFTYKITDLSAGSYTIRMQIDTDANGSSNNEGDYEGYCCGTLAAPIVETADASEVEITTANITGKDFGLKEKND